MNITRMRIKLKPHFLRLSSNLLLLLLLLGSLAEQYAKSHTLEEPLKEHILRNATCNKKDRCELMKPSNDELLKQVAYIFEDNFNHSLKLFSHDFPSERNSSPNLGKLFEQNSVITTSASAHKATQNLTTITQRAVPVFAEIEDHERRK